MPIDPRIALGFQPVQTPDFLGMENQVANIRQSRAAEQNSMALMAQRQRQEQEALNLNNALLNFDPTNTAAVNSLYRMPGGGAAVRDVFEAQRAQTLAGGAAREEEISKRDQALKDLLMPTTRNEVISSVYGSMMRGGLTKEQADSVVQSLPNTDAELAAWQRQRAVQLLTPQERAQTTRFTRDLGGTIQEEVVPTYGQQPGTRTFTPTMTPYQLAQLDLDRQREARIAGEAAKKEEEPFSALGGYNAKLQGAKNVLEAIDDLIGGPNSPPVFDNENKLVSGGGRIKEGEAGFIGARAAALEGSESFNVAATLDVIKANLGFDRLQEMRADPDNKTGGALGQVAVQELLMLQSTVASVKQGQQIKKLYEDLAKIRRHYNNYLKAHEEIDALKQFNRINTGPRFERVPVIKDQTEYEALPAGAPYRNPYLGGELKFKPQTTAPTAAGGATAPAGGGAAAGGVPPGIDPETWKYMTPEDRKLFSSQ